MGSDLGFRHEKSVSNFWDVGTSLRKKFPGRMHSHVVGLSRVYLMHPLPISMECPRDNWSKNPVGPKGWLAEGLGWLLGVFFVDVEGMFDVFLSIPLP